MITRHWLPIAYFSALNAGFVFFASSIHADDALKEVRRYKVPEAHQGVAVDETHFYAISNRVIAKYERVSGNRVATWQADEEHQLVHLNAGIVREGKLFCAHSNYPHQPATSSVEIWDAKSLSHIGTQSFGIDEGALTWVDWRDGKWWAVFAHYSNATKPEKGKDNRWTTLIQFDDQWRRQQAWVFPETVLERFSPYSNSGGAWGPGGLLYCSGHDRGELYALKLPKAGSTLVHVKTLAAPMTGQAFAWSFGATNELFGISRPSREVVVSVLGQP